MTAKCSNLGEDDQVQRSMFKKRHLPSLTVLGSAAGGSAARSLWVATRNRANDHPHIDYVLDVAEGPGVYWPGC